jgi:hypothetical protein
MTEKSDMKKRGSSTPLAVERVPAGVLSAFGTIGNLTIGVSPVSSTISQQAA